MIGDRFAGTNASQFIKRLIVCVPLKSGIANDLHKGVDTALTPRTQQLISLKSIRQTPDDLLRRLLRTVFASVMTNSTLGVKRVLTKLAT